MPHRFSTPPDIHLREQGLPGGRRLFSVTLADGTLVSVVVDAAANTRELTITPPGSDTVAGRFVCGEAEATAIAAILSGVRFVVDEEQPVHAVNLRTVTIGPSSPAVGRRLGEIEVPAPEDARVIAVIQDDAPDLIDQDPERLCRPGDRLVIVGRPGVMSSLVRHLLG